MNPGCSNNELAVSELKVELIKFSKENGKFFSHIFSPENLGSTIKAIKEALQNQMAHEKKYIEWFDYVYNLDDEKYKYGDPKQLLEHCMIDFSVDGKCIVCKHDDEKKTKLDCQCCFANYRPMDICLNRVLRHIRNFMVSDDFVNILRLKHPEYSHSCMCADCGAIYSRDVGICDRCYSPAIFNMFDSLLVRDPEGFYLAEPFGNEEEYYTFKYSASARYHCGANDRHCEIGITLDKKYGVNFTAPDGFRWCESFVDNPIFVRVPKDEVNSSSKDIEYSISRYKEENDTSISKLSFNFDSEPEGKTTRKNRGYLCSTAVYGQNFIVFNCTVSEDALAQLSDYLCNVMGLYLSHDGNILKITKNKPDKPLNLAVLAEYQLKHEVTVVKKVLGH